ncbi:GNAT family N-acetyltransferase [Fictibacillus sp. 23RED33]|uniref:GNAT family N-acetyltransferase n=1 Tax=Fictibacillus sp. 23RED33 TaxID=2745879 RepID=UPI0018CC9D9D|nr:GNAT family N-acetyltransferase [Fictibacillus sp. 23RED33]
MSIKQDNKKKDPRAHVILEYTEEYQNEVIEMISHIQTKEYNVAITQEDQPDLFNVKNFYQTGNGNFWVALYNNKVIGTVSLLDIGNQQVALRKMFVKSEFRGSEYKVANTLLNHAIEWAKEKSVKTISLGTTPQFLAAHRFYEKNGFIKIDMDQLPFNFPVLSVDKMFYQFRLA